MRHALVALTAMFPLLACSSPNEATSDTEAEVQSSTQFLLWNPAAALITEHTNWHSACGSRAGARSCTRRGEDFLKFHRNFLDRLRDDFERQGIAADVTPWYRVPPEITGSSLWRSDDRAAEQAVLTLIDPITRKRFASLNRFGEYVEAEYHNRIHGYAGQIYGESILNNAGMSPKSTYFLKIHGLIEWHFSRFVNGDFDWDGQSDLVMLDTATGQRGFEKMYGPYTEVANLSIPALPAGCDWSLGAVYDVDFNGSTDLVYHAPSCGRVIARLMQTSKPYSPIALPGGMLELNGVNSDYRLVGTGDFDDDVRSDLVWANTAGTAAVIWYMNGSAIRNTATLYLPAGYGLSATGDVDGDGRPDFVLIKQAGDGGIDYFILRNGEGSPIALSGLTRSPYLRIGAVGYYSGFDDASLGTQTRRQADFMFVGQGPGAPAPTYTFQLSTAPLQYGALISMPNPVASWRFYGPR